MSPRKRTTKAGPTPVEALRHTDRRANIPTNELRGMLADDERAPKAMLYPRDPSLDPQLVWKGKDEQDAADLEVPVVPIYIQEKIDPRVIIENLRQTAAAGEPEPELTLFDDFNGIEFEELVDFYQHEQNWANRLILGDSLLVMTSLAEKEGSRARSRRSTSTRPTGSSSAPTGRSPRASATSRTARSPTSPASPSRSGRSATPGSSASTRTSRTCATASSSRASCSPSPARSSSRSATRTSTSCAACSTRSSAARTSSRSSRSRRRAERRATTLAGHDRLHPLVRQDRETMKYRQLYRDGSVGGAGGGSTRWSSCRTARDAG